MKLKGKPVTLNEKRTIILGMRMSQVNAWEVYCINPEDGKFFRAEVDELNAHQISQAPEKDLDLIPTSF